MGRKINFVQFLIYLIILNYFITAKKTSFNIKRADLKLLQGLENISFQEFCQSGECLFSNEVEFEEFKQIFSNKNFLEKNIKIKKKASTSISQQNESCLFDNEGESFNQTEYSSSFLNKNQDLEEENKSISNERNQMKNVRKSIKNDNKNKRIFRLYKKGKNIANMLVKKKVKLEEKKKLVKKFRNYGEKKYKKKVPKLFLNETLECDIINENSTVKEQDNYNKNSKTESNFIDKSINMTDDCDEEINSDGSEKKITSPNKILNRKIPNKRHKDNEKIKNYNQTDCDDNDDKYDDEVQNNQSKEENNKNKTYSESTKKSSRNLSRKHKSFHNDTENEDCEYDSHSHSQNKISHSSKKLKIATNFKNQKKNNITNISDCDSEENNNHTTRKKINFRTNISQLYYNNTLNSSDCLHKEQKLMIPYYNNTFDCSEDHNLNKTFKNISSLFYNNTCGCDNQTTSNTYSVEKLKQIFYNNTNNECKKTRLEEIKRKNKANLANFLFQLKKIEKNKLNPKIPKIPKISQSLFESNHHKKILHKNISMNCDSILNSQNISKRATSNFLINKKKTANLNFDFPKINIFSRKKNDDNEEYDVKLKNKYPNILNKKLQPETTIKINTEIKSLISPQTQKLSNEFDKFMKSHDNSKKIELNFLKSFFENFIKGYQSVPKERKIKKWGKIIKIVENFQASFKCKEKRLTNLISLDFIPALNFAINNLTYENLASGIKRTTAQLNKLIFSIGSRCEGIDVILNMITKDFHSIKVSNQSKKILFSKARHVVVNSLKNFSFLKAGYDMGIIYGIANTFTK
jgi:hypothetical protein